MATIQRAFKGRQYLPGLLEHAVRHPTDLRHLAEWVRLLQPSPLESRVPWLPFVVMEYLQDRLSPEMSVFEYGGGGSTVWFSERVSRVRTVEHDPLWYQQTQQAVPANCQIQLANRDDYPTAIQRADPPFDVVLVDGESRLECLRVAMDNVTRWLVLDDCDRYPSAFELVRWPVTILHGLAPGKAIAGHTAIWTVPS